MTAIRHTAFGIRRSGMGAWGFNTPGGGNILSDFILLNVSYPTAESRRALLQEAAAFESRLKGFRKAADLVLAARDGSLLLPEAYLPDGWENDLDNAAYEANNWLPVMEEKYENLINAVAAWMDQLEESGDLPRGTLDNLIADARRRGLGYIQIIGLILAIVGSLIVVDRWAQKPSAAALRAAVDAEIAADQAKAGIDVVARFEKIAEDAYRAQVEDARRSGRPTPAIPDFIRQRINTPAQPQRESNAADAVASIGTAIVGVAIVGGLVYAVSKIAKKRKS